MGADRRALAVGSKFRQREGGAQAPPSLCLLFDSFLADFDDVGSRCSRGFGKGNQLLGHGIELRRRRAFGSCQRDS
jgi:hypothetical protein